MILTQEEPKMSGKIVIIEECCKSMNVTFEVSPQMYLDHEGFECSTKRSIRRAFCKNCGLDTGEKIVNNAGVMKEIWDSLVLERKNGKHGTAGAQGGDI